MLLQRDLSGIMPDPQPEFWLRGPVEGIPPHLQPVAHALLQSRAEVETEMEAFPDALLWERPAGVASVGFHLQHLSGVLDRLFTYARGAGLSDAQRDALKREQEAELPGVGVQDLVTAFRGQVDAALDALRQTDEQSLLDHRGVGRKQLPSNVLGLLFHAAEHTQRHTGQLLVTARVLRDGVAA